VSLNVTEGELAKKVIGRNTQPKWNVR
jgi:hypothetical protein